MKKEDIPKYLDADNSTFSFCASEKIETPFDIKAQGFLQFAEKDLQSNYSHNIINALSNAKRALDCQIDTLLIGFGYYKNSKSKNWSFIQKINLIKDLGILAPRVLKKINNTRNLMEHEYVKPEKEKVEDFLDITSLFLASTDKYIFSFPSSAGYQQKDKGAVFKLDYKQCVIKVKIHKKLPFSLDYDKIEKENVLQKFTIDNKDDQYLNILKAYLKRTRQY